CKLSILNISNLPYKYYQFTIYSSGVTLHMKGFLFQNITPNKILKKSTVSKLVFMLKEKALKLSAFSY
ncbi:hypothetical protein, partial [Bacillus cereus]|uniref:hypothetical protein n=1 Tax=Bacillus cereus TaxID=1396 RepID=UPI001C5567CC